MEAKEGAAKQHLKAKARQRELEELAKVKEDNKKRELKVTGLRDRSAAVNVAAQEQADRAAARQREEMEEQGHKQTVRAQCRGASALPMSPSLPRPPSCSLALSRARGCERTTCAEAAQSAPTPSEAARIKRSCSSKLQADVEEAVAKSQVRRERLPWAGRLTNN